MAKQAQRKVTRSGNRASITRKYNTRMWYELPDWLREAIVGNLHWVVLFAAFILAPAVLLATFLGARSLPLTYIGIPSVATSNEIGIAAAVLIVEFVLLVTSFRPLKSRRKLGLNLAVVASLVHFGHSLLLQRGISGGLFLLVVFYLYWQLRREYE